MQTELDVGMLGKDRQVTIVTDQQNPVTRGENEPSYMVTHTPQHNVRIMKNYIYETLIKCTSIVHISVVTQNVTSYYLIVKWMLLMHACYPVCQMKDNPCQRPAHQQKPDPQHEE